MAKTKENDKIQQIQQRLVDNRDEVLTTNDGVAIDDNNNTLKAGDRGPALMEDFIYLDKMAHFDRERIPERVVHARGSGAHGVFEATADISKYTSAAFLKKGTKTPLFARFSTVAGFKGSTDLARDIRGFSVKFFTQEGNYDLVGNNTPVFFIQDAINFPDLIHAVKPEPNNEMPQAASAHDTFWDFVSLMPESAHTVMWLMSDRAIPRSLRMMEGFGVHTFKFLNAEGKATFVKFHWKPRLGVHSVAWNEAQKISGFDSDFHRRDLWESIEKGNFPQWDLGVQLVPEEDEHKYSFDLLDATKIIPEELVPVKIIGTMTLNRNPENFFAETEQVAFDPGRLVPGIDLSNDPLLQGRAFSYMDTQNYRLGGPNFHELPINRSVNGKFNNQKDGFGRQDILKGNVSYYPNSLGGGCPYQAMMSGKQGFKSHSEKIDGSKIRQRSASFADHFTQARLFYHSQSPEEQSHIVKGYSFELSKVNSEAVRKRKLAIIHQIDPELAKMVGESLGLIPAKELDELTIQFARQNYPEYPISAPIPEIKKSAALSMKVRAGEGSISTRKVAFLVADGVSEVSINRMKTAVESGGGEAVLISTRMGKLKYKEGGSVEIKHTYLTEASVCYDAFYTPEGDSIDLLSQDPDYIQFINEGYRHCKVLAFDKGAEKLLTGSYIDNKEKDAGLIFASKASLSDAFIEAMKGHRVWSREKARKVPA